jgi:hypothetical protein
MNRTQKGKIIEQKAHVLLAQKGYWIEKARRAKFQPQDLFGCWDFMAVGKREIRFIQVSSERFSSRSRADQERMLAFPKPENTSKEYWRWNENTEAFEITTI